MKYRLNKTYYFVVYLSVILFGTRFGNVQFRLHARRFNHTRTRNSLFISFRLLTFHKVKLFAIENSRGRFITIVNIYSTFPILLVGISQFDI